LNVSRALRAISKPNGGWLRPCTLGDFLLLVQEKVTKEKDPPEPPTPSCASRENRRSPNSPGAEQRASGSNTRLASPDFPCDARRRLRGLKNPADLFRRGGWQEWVFLKPRMAHMSTARLWASAPKGGGEGVFAPSWVGGGAFQIHITRPQAVRQEACRGGATRN
jgi:hypothetical protein